MTIGADTIKQLRQAHRGDIILPGDAHYESGRRVWNAMIDRRPRSSPARAVPLTSSRA